MITILIQLVIGLIILGVVFWLVQSYIPIPAPIKNVIYVVLILILLIWLLRIFGIWHIA